MTAEPGDTSPLMTALMLYSREREAAAAQARKQLGVNELDARALAFVGAHPGVRPSALAAHLGVTSAGVTTMVERLVRRGILRREADETDRRVNHIYVAVDLENEPWSQLAHFDNTCRRIIATLDPRVEADLASFLTHTALAAREQAGLADRATTGDASAA
ncbi:MarR family winged helix-turn-helix transcriptional regulator [Microbacterium trichothecenolyticum]|uniref:Transcriptional regulator n=1 Tax=Microbacterium trichothecenolyticum TaxID=69370 RepID=A0ABU0TVG2_MICTR|nr:helix-turn-helix domain-containing protein [Microbacterium trichothecenolyticum]MDQ1123657.1 putative transcriptional regulator [Microbacterium trichothecenolyticum]